MRLWTTDYHPFVICPIFKTKMENNGEVDYSNTTMSTRVYTCRRGQEESIQKYETQGERKDNVNRKLYM